eukprot:TRINITY_DN3536_c0_g3_i1.p1 TRINITY_DN3536_c0_g3~~TRINITY_DN3536_c0_g3_i1.p1  ORF type:complete len:241 (+),score=113.50 TRINITY_DN3536_c0_g3_i1:51-773(+)
MQFNACKRSADLEERVSCLDDNQFDYKFETSNIGSGIRVIKRARNQKEKTTNNKTIDVGEDQHLAAVFRRVLNFLIDKKNQLPSTPQLLHNYIEALCSFDVQIEPSIIYFHLAVNKAITILPQTNQVTYNLNYDPNTPTVGVVLQQASDTGYFSDDFIYALRLAIEWIITQKSKLFTINELNLNLEKICCINRKIAASSVIGVLQRLGYIYYDFLNDIVIYSLPEQIKQYFYSGEISTSN